MTEQVLDVRGSARLIRRSWRFVSVLTLLGAAGVGAYELRQPPMYHASALVLVPSVAGAAGGSGGATSAPGSHGSTTDVEIALSGDVLVPAARSAGVSLPLPALQRRVAARQAAPNVIRITAEGSKPSVSEALANAVANRLVTFMTASGASSSSGAIVGLEAEAARLKAQQADVKHELAAVQQRIGSEGASSPAGKQDAVLQGQLAAEDSAVGLQLSSVTSQITEAQLGQISAAQGTEVIQRATTATLPSKSSLILPAVLGAVGGFFVASMFVVARKRRDPRLRTRDALAVALGAPVVLTLDVRGRRTTQEWVDLFERHQARASDRWAVRKALRELGVDEATGDLDVVCFGDDRAAMALAAEVGLAATASGFPTTFSVIAAAGVDASALRATCAGFAGEGRQPRAGLHLVDGAPAERRADVGLSVTTVVLDKDQPEAVATTQRGRAAATVLSVSAGFASADQLARTAIAAADAGSPICGVLLANPSPDDQTVGRPQRENIGRAPVGIRGNVHSTAGRLR